MKNKRKMVQNMKSKTAYSKNSIAGITLIALVVTIVVLLILAGVSISLVIGQNGIINKAGDAVEKTKISEEKDLVQLAATAASIKGLGTITEEDLASELTTNIGERDKDYKLTSEDGMFIVKYLESGREYEVDPNGNIGDHKSPEEAPEVGEETFPRSYGVIEVEFLDGTTYNTTTTANPPNKASGMKAVYWDSDGNEIVEGDSNFDESKWYSYTAQSGYTENGGTSKWANAKTEDGSYWVWIPRYAYRIVYFDTSEHANAYRLDNTKTDGIIGYSDARGMIDINGKAVPNISDSSTAIAVNDKKFRTHPAFESDVEKGGWGSKISGIWVAKFEMSMETNGVHTETSSSSIGNVTTSATVKAVSKPGVSSWRYINVGNMYTNAYNYDRAKESHMMKNSEWGAVAYLADSRYGRNGTEVTINNSSSYITGNAGNSISASSASGVTNAYNTAKGALASTTGNIYGIYDLSGGAREYVSAFNKAGQESYLNNYGSSFASLNGASTKYATAYNNPQSSYQDDFSIGMVSIMGDAMQEIYLSNSKGWNQDYVDFVSTSSPFLTRGDYYFEADNAGLFYSYSGTGAHNVSARTFRVVLVP